MNFGSVEAVANAVLYEGYILYPYRPSALKNHLRWMFGVVAPRSAPGGAESGQPSSLRCELLLAGDAATEIEAKLRFLHPAPTDGGEATLCEVSAGPAPIGTLAGTALERRFVSEAHGAAIEGELSLDAQECAPGVYRMRVGVSNLAPPIEHDREAPGEGTDRWMVSTQVLLGTTAGEFVELRSPPEALRALADGCRSEGLWPTLVGEPGARDVVLCSPIILDDYPQIAPESPGDFFDSTEIDELLTLRILTLTPEEKRAMAAAGDRPAGVLRRTEALGLERLARLHGTLRTPLSGGQTLRPGDRVRLRPRGRNDVFDLALDGRIATVQSLEQDYDGRRYVSVSIDDDPGSDLGALGQPGHRFFFAPEEVERVMDATAE